jgi:hypothetical protein
MSHNASAPHEERWKVLARQAANENDPTRLMALVKELLEERDRVERKHSSSSEQQGPASPPNFAPNQG